MTASRGRQFLVSTGISDTHLCELRGKLKKEAENETPVAVGDDVFISLTHQGAGVIEEVAPRRSIFYRPQVGVEKNRQIIAANLTTLAIVVSVGSPPLKSGLVDRFLFAAYLGEMKPLIIINKADLGTSDEDAAIINTYRRIGYAVLVVSVDTGAGIDALVESLSRERSLLVGHSGVGKSSLLNAVLPAAARETGAVSAYSNKGKHTTTSIAMYPLPHGGHLVDSPGLKVMGFERAMLEHLSDCYQEFHAARSGCRFPGCAHDQEPDCGVKRAVASGEIARFRYDNYLAIAKSLGS